MDRLNGICPGYEWALLFSSGGMNDIKWYEHDSHMKELSEYFESTMFSLQGDGEEQGDEWIKYYKGGQSYEVRRPEWTPPPFEPALLS